MPKGYHHMTQEIRSQIYALKATEIALRKIGSIVGYDASAISREINRNTSGRGYRYKQADAMAKERRVKANGRRLGLSCKDQTLFCSMGALVGKNSEHMEFSKSSGTIHYGVLAGSTSKDCCRCPLNPHY